MTKQKTQEKIESIIETILNITSKNITSKKIRSRGIITTTNNFTYHILYYRFNNEWKAKLRIQLSHGTYYDFKTESFVEYNNYDYNIDIIMDILYPRWTDEIIIGLQELLIAVV